MKKSSLVGTTVIYGGSFNPPHIGHQMACLYLLEALGAEAIWVVPARRHPFGKSLTDFNHRVAMCRILAQPFDGRVEVSRVEEDADLSGRTYDTLVHLTREHADRRLAFAVGSDILGETRTWHRWSDIEALVPVIVIRRAGCVGEGDGLVTLPEVSSSDIRRRIAERLVIEGLVPLGVADYIASHSLYRQ
ncbi:MAG: nicotinate (nicotinamide) nucleotide adenylyltransferase [Myxococcota bacterium]